MSARCGSVGYDFAMPVADIFEILGIAVALGLLVGMQRERVEAPLAGLRTFALITLLGAMCGLLAQHLGAWVIVAGLLAVSAATAVGNVISMGQNRPDPGITTEIAMLVMFAVGAYLPYGPREIAVVVGGGTAVLLHAKGYFRAILKRLADDDIRAVMQIALIALVILPVLPNEPFGPFRVLNLRQIWWMVVLVVGISFGGYLALKFLGERAGTILSGLLGGVISSTATTVSYARRAKSDHHVNAAALVIMLASAVVYGRVLLEVGIVAPRQFWEIAPPVLIMFAVGSVSGALAWWWSAADRAEPPPRDSPTELQSALIFGVLYTLVLLAVAAAKHYFGDRGIFIVAGVSGLTDMDAITLSTARMAAEGNLTSEVAWRAIIVATIANLLFKAGIIALLGGRWLLARIAILFGINIAAGAALLLAWRE